MRAPDPYTVEYELAEPFSELLLQLTMFTNAIHNKDSVEALGKDYGVKGADGTGPVVLRIVAAAHEIVLKRHDAYRWGPSMYENKGPVKFEKLVIKIVPEDSSRVAAMMAGQFDITHQFPRSSSPRPRRRRCSPSPQAKPNFQLLYFGFKTSRPMVADKRVREAMSIAINRAEIAKGILLGNADPAFTFVDPGGARLRPDDQGHDQGGSRARQGAARRGGLEARRRRHPREGRRQAHAQGLLHPANANSPGSPRRSRAICGGSASHWQLQPWDSTIAPLKMAEQDYEIWSVTVPYLSAGDLMNIYFDSRNIPTPNRMNWKDAETDEWLRQGRAALSEADRTKYYALVQQKVTAESLWMPVLNINMYEVTNKKLKGMRPHMIYQNTFYKGLDANFYNRRLLEFLSP